jgi:O-6-methylguanine DNA methyltransferase
MNDPAYNVIYYSQIHASPAGALWIAVTGKGLYAVEFDKPEAHFLRILSRRAPGATIIPDEAHTQAICRQIGEYLQGQRSIFDLDVDLSGLPAFQQAVMQATLAVPYGQTTTYGEIAAAIGHPGAARAVGRAGATNPIPLVVPCHRVIGRDGKLHGYGGPGGIQLKAQLLEMERANH